MKVLFLGNMNNNHYRLAKGLRRKDVDVHLWLHSYDYYSPEDVDEYLKNGYPSWIKRVSFGDPFSFYPLNIHSYKRYSDELAQFDIVITVHYGLTFLQQFGYKGITVFLPSGPDIFFFPFYLNRLRALRRRYTLKTIYRVTKEYRKAVRACDYHLGLNEMHTSAAHKKLGIPLNKMIPLGQYIEANTIRENIKDIAKTSDRNYCEIFSPSRIAIWEDLSLGKNQHILLEAVSKLPSEFLNKIRLKFVKKGSLSLFEGYIKKYNLAHIIDYQPFVPHHELYKSVVNTDIVFSQVSHWGIYGSASLESFTCGKPTVVNIAKDYDQIAGGRPIPPCIDVLEPENLMQHIKSYLENPEPYLKMGLDAAEWVEEYHGEGLLDKYIVFLDMVCHGKVDRKALSFKK